MTARIRTIKPEFFQDEDLGRLSPIERLAFIGIWTQADREGRLEDRPERLKVQILPYDGGADFVKILDTLVVENFLMRYEANGHKYLQVRTFHRHQRPNHREAKSEIPGVPGQARARVGGREGKGMEERKESESDARVRALVGPAAREGTAGSEAAAILKALRG